jgi:hypothetical protein
VPVPAVTWPGFSASLPCRVRAARGQFLAIGSPIFETSVAEPAARDRRTHRRMHRPLVDAVEVDQTHQRALEFAGVVLVPSTSNMKRTSVEQPGIGRRKTSTIPRAHENTLTARWLSASARGGQGPSIDERTF